jgi:hypothetical protein
MNIQEQEERDYRMGMGTDLQNAFALSRLELPPDDSANINELVGAGRFCVVMECTVYCNRTDGILGSRKTLLADCDSAEEAHQKVLGIEQSDDCSIYVVGPKVVQLSEPLILKNDEIPF